MKNNYELVNIAIGNNPLSIKFVNPRFFKYKDLGILVVR